MCDDAAAEPEVQAPDHVEQHVEPTRIDEVATLLLCFKTQPLLFIVYSLRTTVAFCGTILVSFLLCTSLY